MAAVSAKLSDLSILTNDNPRTEDPLEIISQIRTGFPLGAPYLEIPDRLQAIEKAAGLAKTADIVLIAGKGHESYQEVNGVKHHFDDREVLKSLGAAPSAP